MPGSPAPGQPWQQPTQGKPMRPEEEKLWAIAAHLGPIIGLSFVVPLVVWLVFKDRSAFLDRHAKEALNFQISFVIYFTVATLSIILLIGLVLLPIAGVIWVVLMVLATIKAANFEDYRYPLTIRLVK